MIVARMDRRRLCDWSTKPCLSLERCCQQSTPQTCACTLALCARSRPFHVLSDLDRRKSLYIHQREVRSGANSPPRCSAICKFFDLAEEDHMEMIPEDVRNS